MTTLLSQVCFSLTGSHLPEDIFDNFLFYRYRDNYCRSKMLSPGIQSLLSEMEPIGKLTQHQIALDGIPYDEPLASIKSLMYTDNKFSRYFFEHGRPTYVSIMTNTIDQGVWGGHHCIFDCVSVILYFEDHLKMNKAGGRIYRNGLHPQRGYRLVPIKTGRFSVCYCCKKFLPLVAEKHRQLYRIDPNIKVIPEKCIACKTRTCQLIDEDSDME
jgi:hypothetical protein